MTANTQPRFFKAPNISFGGAVLGPSANTALDGSGANTTSIWQADATEGGGVLKVILKPVGSPAATVARLFLCSVTGAFTAGTSNTAANCGMVAEMTLPAITQTQTAAQPPFEIPVNIYVQAGYRLLLTFGTSTGAAGSGCSLTTVGGDF